MKTRQEENVELQSMEKEETNGKFASFEGLDPRIARALRELSFEKLTPIQEQAIPALMEGKDIVGQAQTGTGKTAAFGIPLLQKISPDNKNLQAIVMCPTRELAVQAADEIRKFARYLHDIKLLPVYGGEEIYKQIKGLKGAQIVVGTPGRIMDHIRRKTIRMENVKMVVLDEADVMLDMGFREDMESILSDVQGDHQTALFSATMPGPILEISRKFQKEDREYIKVAARELTAVQIRQYYYEIGRPYKIEAACHILDYEEPRKCLIFVNTKRMAAELNEELRSRHYVADALHGDLTQDQRDMVMNRFRSGNLSILIATDVAARGIDVEEVDLVINFDVPDDIEYYVHRIGRTGRAGRSGLACTLITPREKRRIQVIEQVCKTKMEKKELPSTDEVVIKRAGRILKEAVEESQTLDTGILNVMVEKVCEETGISQRQLSAALLHRCMGKIAQEIPKETTFSDRRRKHTFTDDRKFGKMKNHHDRGAGFGRARNGQNDRDRNGGKKRFVAKGQREYSGRK